MASPASQPRMPPPLRRSAPVRPSGVMPAFRGSFSLPVRPSVAGPRVQTPSDDELWNAAIAAAKQRALVEDEEREWQLAMARAKALVAAQEEREWAALRARVAQPPRRLHSWP